MATRAELDAENAKLSARLALTCKENSTLTSEVAALKRKVVELTKAPFEKDSVLAQLYDAEKAQGWFGGSKNSAKEQLQKLCDTLQKEYVSYKTSHTHADDEVESLMKRLESAQTKCSELATIVQERSERGAGDGDSKALKRELEEKKKEISRLQRELQSSPSSRTPGGGSHAAAEELEQLRIAQGEVDSLRNELEALKKALATEERLHKIKAEESEELSRRMEVMRTQHREEIAELKVKSNNKNNKQGLSCEQCSRYAEEVEELRKRATTAQEELARVRLQVTETASVTDKKYATLEARLMDTQVQLTEKIQALQHSVPEQDLEVARLESKQLRHETSLLKDRITHLETMRRSGGEALEDDEILAALARHKERVSTLEFEKEQFVEQLHKMEATLAEVESKRAEEQRTTADDKQRVSFLLKKCATLGATVRKLESEKDNLSDTLISMQAEAQRYQHQAEAIPELERKIEEVEAEKQLLEDRLAAAKDIEENLVKAKETIAYMELSQSRSISLMQYAELQTQKQKLEHQVLPLQKQLKQAQEELEQLREEKKKEEIETTNQVSSEENLKEELEGLKENEKILREKLSHYKEENRRLVTTNTALESQMKDMQNGIREMAIHMEQERTSAKEAAEKAAEKEVSSLREELERARSTIAGIKATEGQFVSEGLYLSAVEEKQELFDDVQRKTLEIEKLKSEILIYRQTIAELETENDEHVKDLEDLQQQLEEERTNGEQRQVENEKQLVDAQEELLELRDAVKKQQEVLEENQQTIDELTEKSAKQQKAYEQKLQSEMRLMEQLAAAGKKSGGGKSAGNVGIEAAALSVVGANSSATTGNSPANKKKVKKIKKKKTLAEQLSDGEEDVLCAAAASPPSNAQKQRAEAGAIVSSFQDRNDALELLQQENLRLKSTIEKLSKELEVLQANGGKGASEGAGVSNVRKELQEAVAAVEKLRQERDDVKAELKRAQALNRKGPVGGSSSGKERELEEELKHVKAELRSVAEQLLPTKEKLSEYEAMADRVGISYPFSMEFEKKLARKARSIKKREMLSVC